MDTATSTADLTGYRAAHTALRSAAHDMAAAAPTLTADEPRRLAAFRRYWAGYAGEVVAHHTTEDDVVFPALLARVPAMDRLTERTDGDHDRLDELMADVTAALAAVADGAPADRAAGLLREVADHMEEHLALEDAEILPVIEESFTQEEYDALEEEALKIIGLGSQAIFTLPFLAARVDAATLRTLMAGAPLPVKVIIRLFGGRHARLAALALGRTAVPTPV